MQRARATCHKQRRIGNHLAEAGQSLPRVIDGGVSTTLLHQSFQRRRHLSLTRSSSQHTRIIRVLLLQTQDQGRVLLQSEIIRRPTGTTMHHQPGFGRIDPQLPGGITSHGDQQTIGELQIGRLGLDDIQLLLLQEMTDQIQIVLGLRLG